MLKPSRTPRMLAIPAVAEHLAVSTKTIRRWIAAGELRVHRLGHQIRISEDDLAAFLNGRRR